MTSRILVDPNLAAAKQLLEYVDAVADAVAKGRRLKAQLDSMPTAMTGRRSRRSSACPIPAQVSSTAAQDAWTIISTAQAAIDVPAVRELARLDQG
jgi:hypothetical protein